jgi:hypothetical protein
MGEYMSNRWKILGRWMEGIGIGLIPTGLLTYPANSLSLWALAIGVGLTLVSGFLIESESVRQFFDRFF